MIEKMTTPTPTVAFVSLGCPKNMVDSEVMLGGLAMEGFAICGEADGADVVVVNTCGFLKASEEESMGVIRSMLDLKRQGRIKGVVVAGCLPQRRVGSDLFPDDVDAVMGLTDRARLTEVCREIVERNGSAVEHRRRDLARWGDPLNDPDMNRFRLTPRHYAYVRISEGCDRTCSFCIIPKIRGKFQSKKIPDIVAETRELAADGAKEIIVIAQDTTSYGLDLERRTMLPELIDAISAIDGVQWIRLMYCYPTHLTDRMIETVKTNPKVVKYIDLPVQHTVERLLRLMRRGITAQRQGDLIRAIRREVPGVVLRTSVIVGFPGETEEEFGQLLRDLEEFRFERLGAFRYSPEEGTPAATLDGQISADVIEERYDRIMRSQQKIAFAYNRGLVGQRMDVLIDQRSASDGWEGRTAGDAPEIDGKVIVRGKNRLHEGAIAPVEITNVSGYDLLGRADHEPSE